MRSLKIFFAIFLSFAQLAQAEIKQSNEGEDVLSTVSQKLTQIDQQLKDRRVNISTAVISWPEFDKFRDELMFTVAHDPHGSVKKDTPPELNPIYLTQKLKQTWTELEVSVLEIGNLAKNPEWMELKLDMEKFFHQRDSLLYQPARTMIKSGHIAGRLSRIKEAAISVLKASAATQDYSLKVFDPHIEKLALELSTLNRSIGQLSELRNPPAVENVSIFQPKHFKEVLMLGGAALFSGFFLTISFLWLRTKMKKTPPETVVDVSEDAFNYHEWLKRLENNLQFLKNHEENFNEEHINLKELVHQLSEARKGLNMADNQQEYYTSLELLNASSPRIEDYFQKMNLRKHSEASRRIIKQVIQICDAIENKKEMSFESERPKLRVIKQEQLRVS